MFYHENLVKKMGKNPIILFVYIQIPRYKVNLNVSFKYDKKIDDLIDILGVHTVRYMYTQECDIGI